MPSYPAIPLAQDVLEYIEEVFSNANERVTTRLDRMPTTHEEWLDYALIDALSDGRGPHMTSSGTIVDIDAHFVGGGRHFQRWEIADIGLIINFRQGDRLLRTKVVLLQSKRMYPREAELIEELGLARPGGFGSLMNPSLPATMGSRTFHFDADCRYQELRVGSNQWRVIEQYESDYGLPVHYLLYHPRVIPSQASIPVLVPRHQTADVMRVGARVIQAVRVRAMAAGLPENGAPSYSQLSHDGAVGTILPEFVVRQVLTCRDGYVAEDGLNNPGLIRVFNLRSGPIAAAVRMDIITPG